MPGAKLFKGSLISLYEKAHIKPLSIERRRWRVLTFSMRMQRRILKRQNAWLPDAEINAYQSSSCDNSRYKVFYSSTGPIQHKEPHFLIRQHDTDNGLIPVCEHDNDSTNIAGHFGRVFAHQCISCISMSENNHLGAQATQLWYNKTNK